VREAKGLVMAGEGVANSSIAEALGVSRSTVLQWRSHFETDGVEWVGEVHEGRGRKPVITQEQIDQMISDTLHTTPPDATHWSNRTMADHCGLSRTTVQREWRARGIKPHLVKAFKLTFRMCGDPFTSPTLLHARLCGLRSGRALRPTP
jgi:DNA-binding XRE family transcriptional regulator